MTHRVAPVLAMHRLIFTHTFLSIMECLDPLRTGLYDKLDGGGGGGTAFGGGLAAGVVSMCFTSPMVL